MRGLTTAANLWLTASIGMAAGLGFAWGAGITAALALLVLVGLKPLERFIERFRRDNRIPSDQDISSDEKPAEPQG